jgi:ABC-2 type transport system ATP-binding protein
LRVDRGSISRVLAAVLADHTLEDISVEDPPLEEVIAQVFTTSANNNAESQNVAVKTV